MATQSSIPAWENPWTEEPGGLKTRGYSPWITKGVWQATVLGSGLQKSLDTTQ